MLGRLLTVLVLVTAGCVAPGPATHVPAAQPQADEPAPHNLFLLDSPRPFGTTVSEGAEPMIHVTRDGSTILIGDWTGLYRSTDGGATWPRAPNPFLEIGNVLADGWAIAEDDAGRVYVADTNGPNVGVASSSDRGATWDVRSPVVEVNAIADRPWLAARGDGEVALITNVIRADGSSEACARSFDGGRTFLDRSLVNDGRPNAGNAAFDSRGRLWFSDGTVLWRWSNPCLAAPTPFHQPAGGAQIFTQVAIDPQDRVLFAQPSTDNRQMQLWRFAPGQGFSMLAVSPPELRSNTFGALSVHTDGSIAVAWYGSEAAGNPAGSFNGEWNVFVARVTGFGTANPTIVHDRLTSQANHVGGFCMNGIGCSTGDGDRDLLDYFGVDHGPDGVVHVAYGHDGAGSRAEVRYARIP